MINLFFKFSMGSWLSAAISLFTTPIVTALIVPEEFGRASMYTLAFNILVQLALLGTDQSFVRKFYQQSTDAYHSRLLINSIGVPLILGLFICATLFVFKETVSEWLIGKYSFELIVLLSLTLIAGLFERYAMLMLRMRKQAIQFSLLRVLFAVVNFLVIFTYANTVAKDFYAIIYGNFFGLAFCAIVAIFRTGKLWKPAMLESALIKEILYYGFPFLPAFLILWVFEGIDKVALRQYSDFYEIGLFSAAYKIVAILSILQAAFSSFWAPVAFEMYEKSSENARQTFSKVFAYMSGIFFLGGLGLVLGKEIVVRLFDKSYHEVSSIMPFLLLVPIMYTLSEVTVGGINYKNKTYWHLLIAAVAALTNYLLNTFLVPKYGAKGAAISTGLSYIVFFYSRTYISNLLFAIKINHVKLNLSVGLFLVVVFINSFYSKEVLTYVITAIIGLLIVILYRAELVVFQKSITDKIKPKTLVIQK
jgi:O-antigen/teichoic acid export membrane protein